MSASFLKRRLELEPLAVAQHYSRRGLARLGLHEQNRPTMSRLSIARASRSQSGLDAISAIEPTSPDAWPEKKTHGAIDKFDDLPGRYKGNVNTSEVPYDRKPGDEPHLTPIEIDAVVAFLRTLSDGYMPGSAQSH